jgi:DNA-binding transcriptional LysR family regulator
MDKLRAIEYFVRTVEAGSFGAAARSLDVSTPAVSQLVGTLERSLGIALLHRSPRGIALTADGRRYYEVLHRLTDDLRDIERQLGPGLRPRGTLTVGMRAGVAQACVMPHIARFLARYPEVDLILKPVETLEEVDSQDLDIAVMTGWAPTRDYAVRMLGNTRSVICASPDYWRRIGEPKDPDDLRGHECLVLRSSGGTLLDRWVFERNGERRTVDVRARVLSHQSTWIQDAACAGAGVIRVADFSVQRHLANGLLVATLADWEVLESPMHFAVFRARQRRSRVVRAFLDFLVEVFGASQADAATRQPGRPEWFGRVHGRQSMHATVPRIAGARANRRP